MWRRIAIVTGGVILLVTAGVFGARLMLQVSGPDSIEDVVRDMEFRPIRPPNTVDGPGTLYRVNAFGSVKARICSANGTQTAWEEGRTEQRTLRTFSDVETRTETGCAMPGI